MNLLAVEASGIAGSVAYFKDGRVIGEYYICHKLTHSETIMPMMEHLKKIIEINLEEIDAIAVTSGPGSFTGLRIGVTTAKAMALALDVPVVGIPTLDVIANNIPYSPYKVCPIMDARRNQVYTSLYEWRQEKMERISEYQAIDIDIYLKQLEESKESILFLGDAVWLLKDRIKNVLGERAHFAKEAHLLQRASILGELAIEAYKNGEYTCAAEFVPMYLRKSQAEREREEREKNGN